MNDVFQGKIILIGPKHQVTRSQAQTAAMGKQIPHGKLFRYVRIVHFKLGNDLVYFGVPSHFFFIDQHPERRKGPVVEIEEDRSAHGHRRGSHDGDRRTDRRHERPQEGVRHAPPR